MAKVSNKDICTSNRCEIKGQASHCFFLLSFTLFFLLLFFLCVVKERDLLCGHQDALLLKPYAAKQKNVGLGLGGDGRTQELKFEAGNESPF